MAGGKTCMATMYTSQRIATNTVLSLLLCTCS